MLVAERLRLTPRHPRIASARRTGSVSHTFAITWNVAYCRSILMSLKIQRRPHGHDRSLSCSGECGPRPVLPRCSSHPHRITAHHVERPTDRTSAEGMAPISSGEAASTHTKWIFIVLPNRIFRRRASITRRKNAPWRWTHDRVTSYLVHRYRATSHNLTLP